MSDGHLWAADLCFLVAAILFIVAAVVQTIPTATTRLGVLIPAGLAAVALGLFLL